ncbi:MULTISPECIES: ABC transporter ATP-binding protein [Thiomicrorhabdus]|uniref:ABC transporter ATP-binding protein n=1 Tax=Thiomicrorhabdus heinhorstiae TaxID=2748010 RepID=A0ABS0BW78_9GAMM|nr:MULTISPECIES: ABC transporter ATP-binding protein [Thiomicrorhabdus]MBF6058065.1 ABC transporter ATP-binding protein [Thiomicrorhabdus heinhorstiae]
MLALENVTVVHDKSPVLNACSLCMQTHEILGLMGKSGSGKTTLLRTIAGFQNLHQGVVSIGQRCLSKPGFCTAPEQRAIGMVFQDFALFPHLTVEENIVFGLKGQSSQQKKSRALELANMMEISELLKRYPHELSGGQQQRVAIARAMAPKPSLILFDEPFSSLDRALAMKLAKTLREWLKQEQMTALVVTHSSDEAHLLCDRLAHLNAGSLQFDEQKVA